MKRLVLFAGVLYVFNVECMKVKGNMVGADTGIEAVKMDVRKGIVPVNEAVVHTYVQLYATNRTDSVSLQLCRSFSLVGKYSADSCCSSVIRFC